MSAGASAAKSPGDSATSGRPAPSRLGLVSLERLGAMGDGLILRDARARSSRPALVRIGEGLEIRGGFTMIQSFSITPKEGRTFVEASRDANPIHTEDSVVSGAMTAARFLLTPEIVIPGLAVKNLRVKFRAFSRYDRPTVNVFTFRPGSAGAVTIQARSFQRGVLVADAALGAAIGDPVTPCATARHPDGASSEVIRAFFESLRLDPDLCFECLGFGYPRAFLASLPPGEMVRHGGAGGLLNVLDLEFQDSSVPAIENDPPPCAEIDPPRPRHNFLKILARVGSGIRTYCRGYATVLASVVARGGGPAPVVP